MADALKAKGNAALQNEKFDEAIDFYTQAINIDGENHVLWSNRSAAYAKKAKYEDALKDAEKCISLNPKWAKGYSRKGAALAFLKRTEEAIDIYEEGLKIDPENKQMKEALSDLNKNAFNPFSAPDFHARLMTDPRTRSFCNDPGFKMKLQMLQQNPNLMSSLANDEQIREAIMVALGVPSNFNSSYEPPAETSPSKSETKDVPKTPKDDLNDPQKQAQCEKEQGNAAYKKKDFTTALEHYNKAFELDPNNITYLLNKAAVFFEQGEFEQCINTCEEAIEVGRKIHSSYEQIAKAFARIGNVHFKKADFPTALEYYNKSIAEHRAPAVLQKISETKRKIKDAEIAAYIDPEKSVEERIKGNELFQKGKFPEAIKCYDEAIKRNPKDAKGYSNRAACYIKLGEFNMAVKDCDESIKIDKTFIKSYLRKAQALSFRDSTKAKEAYEAALEIDPNCTEAKEGLSNLQYQSRAKLFSNANKSEEDIKQQAMQNPEVIEILQDPIMRTILTQMQEDPKAVRDHLKNPEIAEKIQKLAEAGILQMR